MMVASRRRGGRAYFGQVSGGMLAFGLFALAVAPAAWAQTVAPKPEAVEPREEDEESPYQSGLIARYTGTDGVEHVRLEEEIAFAWGNRPPDRRIAAGPFHATFEGQLLVQAPGAHRLRVFAAGQVRIKLDGTTLLDESSREPQWLDSEEIDLPFGYHALEVRYARTDEPARITLFWEGPQFQLEPLAGRWLFHETQKSPSSAFEEGGRLVRALRCAACHEIAGESASLPAPALDYLAGNLSRAWLVDWLAATARDTEVGNPNSRSTRRMPHFGLDRPTAARLADELLATSEKAVAPPANAPSPVAAQDKKDKKRDKLKPADLPRPPSAAGGATLFRSVGCLACHRVGDLGSDGLFGGGDLSTVADKRPADFFARWLADPPVLNRNHRMPTFALTSGEIESLSLYLQTLKSTAEPMNERATVQTKAGGELLRQFRCAQCHALARGAAAERDKRRLKLDAAAIDREDSCLGQADPARNRPGYRLDAPQRKAVAQFITDLRPTERVVDPTGEDLLTERNCLACHARGSSRGLAPHLPPVADADPDLRDVLPALAPPSLAGVGDKLRDEVLAASIAASQPARRTWLRVRMPKFPLSDAETKSLARHFTDSDRIPDRPNAPPDNLPTAGDSAIDAAGARLVTADGFGCTSCHAIGKWKPEKVALNAEGADLSALGSRVRHAWFERWLRNPARIVPQMEMPSVQQPIRGVLDGRLDRQIAAVWQVLNRTDFTPPAPNALRVVRRANLPGVTEPAAVLTEVIEVGGRMFVKPLVIGLANRHNVLVDLATGRLAAWWIGDTARQQTRGKTWLWEAGIPQLLPIDKRKDATAESDLSLVRDGRSYQPVPGGQYVTEFDSLQHTAGGLQFVHRLHFAVGAGAEPETSLRVVQQFSPLPADGPGGASGFGRRVQIDAVPAGCKVELLALAGDATVDPKGAKATLLSGTTRLHLAARSQGAILKQGPTGVIVALSASPGRSATCELEYRADVAVDSFAPLPAIDRSVTRQALDVVPGFEAVRLPVSDQAMPTGLAWRRDATLVVSSLEGRVWLGHDSDGDGLEDKLVPFSDDLAAPFGVETTGDAIDVINKYGLLRLFDADGDGRADRTELLASGWGHTRDYHDWAVGLPRDDQGNYYVSLPCQQDERTEIAATLRGTVIKLVPRQPTDDNPQRFAIEPLCGGLRFPQGIALSRGGELFVTDNQGNYTPFNELNHIVKGARYGFINRLESQRGLSPPFEPAAIEIPHPWTRSVNGICFLETPAAVRQRLGHDLFGPFENHLVGCEYDTRRLVRMSLDRVGDTWQGAVYPMSVEPAAGEETFEGPLVCRVSPSGDVYVGNIRDSGWGAGANTGSLVRLRWRGDLPPGIAEVRVARGGFTLRFTAPVDRARASDAASYAVSSYRRVPTPSYGGPDLDRRVETVKSARLSQDCRMATIELDGLREGFVYEFHLRELAPRGLFFPSEAYYTLRRLAP